VQKFNNTFLAIQFKMRYKYRYQRNYGAIMDHRNRQQLRRHFTMFGLLKNDRARDKSYKHIYKTLNTLAMKD
jgi:hypothetical protein